MIERDERMKQLITQQDIIDEYRQSEACQTLKRLKMFEISLHVFRRNYQEWQQYIGSHRPSNPLEALARMQHSHWVEGYLIEITCLLHNFTAGALTLVDSSRMFYREMYEPNH